MTANAHVPTAARLLSVNAALAMAKQQADKQSNWAKYHSSPL